MRRARSAVCAGLAGLLVLQSTAVALAANRPAPASPGPGLGVGVEPRAPTQVVVYDRQLKFSTIASRDQTGVPGFGSSSRPSISQDGSFVAFQSDASLVTNDADRETDVYLYDRAIGGAQLVSRRLAGGSNGSSRNPSISADASIVAFASNTTNLTEDGGLDADRTQVFAWQRLTGEINLVSFDAGGNAGNGNSGDPSTSADGRVVGFESTATDLVEGDTNGVRDVFLRDLTRGATIRASSGGGNAPGSERRRPSVSADGGAVVFDSTSVQLVPGDSNGARDVFVRDLPPAVMVTPIQLEFGLIALGDVGTGNVSVTSVGWTPVTMIGTTISGGNAGDFVVAGDTCSTFVIPYGSSCAIDVLSVPLAEGAREGVLEILDDALDSPQRVALRTGVPAPAFRVEPAVGPPGIVALLRGIDLPVGTTVNVQWDRGITQGQQVSAVVGADGTVTIQMLVFHHDQLGLRQLLVTPSPGGQQFTATQVPFLVVAPPLQPPGDSAISFLAPALRLILIRR